MSVFIKLTHWETKKPRYVKLDTICRVSRLAGRMLRRWRCRPIPIPERTRIDFTNGGDILVSETAEAVMEMIRFYGED